MTGMYAHTNGPIGLVTRGWSQPALAVARLVARLDR
jgi:hypothetical protein